MLKYKKIPEIVRNKIDKSIRIGYGKPKCTLIWMHGLGDSAEGFFSYFTHLVSPVY
jgi:predicted esterase